MYFFYTSNNLQLKLQISRTTEGGCINDVSVMTTFIKKKMLNGLETKPSVHNIIIIIKYLYSANPLFVHGALNKKIFKKLNTGRGKKKLKNHLKLKELKSLFKKICF